MLQTSQCVAIGRLRTLPIPMTKMNNHLQLSTIRTLTFMIYWQQQMEMSSGPSFSPLEMWICDFHFIQSKDFG